MTYRFRVIVRKAGATLYTFKTACEGESEDEARRRLQRKLRADRLIKGTRYEVGPGKALR